MPHPMHRSHCSQVFYVVAIAFVAVAQETRPFAKELIWIQKQNSHLTISKAQLQSVQMQVNEAFSVHKIEGSIKAPTGTMKDVNTLVPYHVS